MSKGLVTDYLYFGKIIYFLEVDIHKYCKISIYAEIENGKTCKSLAGLNFQAEWMPARALVLVSQHLLITKRD